MFDSASFDTGSISPLSFEFGLVVPVYEGESPPVSGGGIGRRYRRLEKRPEQRINNDARDIKDLEDIFTLLFGRNL